MLIEIIENDDKIIISGTKKVLIPLIKDKGFKKSLKELIKELNSLLVIFIEANGHNVDELETSKSDLNEIFITNKYFKEFISKYLSLQKNIENAQYISENPIYVQRKLDNELNELKSLVLNLYPDFIPKHKVVNFSSIISSFIKKSIIFTVLLIGLLLLSGIGYILVQELLIRL